MPPFADWRLLRKMSRNWVLESSRRWFTGNFCGLEKCCHDIHSQSRSKVFKEWKRNQS